MEKIGRNGKLGRMRWNGGDWKERMLYENI
jgi:hypothetical protein